MEIMTIPRSNTEHTRMRTLVFAAKAWMHRLRRAILLPPAVRFVKSPKPAAAPLAAESRTPLRASIHPAEQRLQDGKVRNLTVAAQFLDGLRISAGEVFSFWRHVPRPTRGTGFTEGRELREGCIVPSVGGGLCQLSNALYAVALDARCEILERHAHSRSVPGSAAEAGRDATVFWNYVDLRFRPRHDFWIEVVLTDEDLVVRLHGKAPQRDRHQPAPSAAAATITARSCETCGEETCFRHREFHRSGNRGRED